MSKKPHIYAYCDAGCKWEVPHKADVPYREDITVVENKTLTLGDTVKIADINMLHTAFMGATVKLTIEVTPNANYQGNLYTAFFTADNVYKNWLIPTDECGFVEMVVSYAGSNPVSLGLTLMTETTNIIKVKEFVVCQLGVPVFAMTGATELSAGKAGTVPAPEAGEHDFVLHGDGTWREHIATDEQVGRAVENYLAENSVGDYVTRTELADIEETIAKNARVANTDDKELEERVAATYETKKDAESRLLEAKEHTQSCIQAASRENADLYEFKIDADSKFNAANRYTDNAIGSLKKETWTFTLEDGSTVTKAVYIG